MNRFRRYGLRLLITLLIVVYTLTNAGRFHIIDEVSLFALTESVALRGALDTNAIAWTQWVNSPGEVLGEFGPDGQVFSKKGPAPALLAVPWYLLLRTLAHLNIHLGLLQGTLLWNGLVTAFTAALLWLTAVRMGYSERTGAALGLLFGLCTIAWPYANHFFGEPLSALSLLACFYALLSYRQSQQLRWMWLAGLTAGLVITTVTAHAILVAILLGYWLIGEALRLGAALRANNPGGSRAGVRFLFALVAFGLPLLLAVAILLWYNLVRFGDPFVTGYHFGSGEGFTTPIWQGFWGLMASPYRGLFWHTPLFFATPFAFAAFLCRHRAEALLIAVLSAVLIGLYSMWWMWWGGFAWGPRFLVPLGPFWVLVLSPWVERLTAPSESVGRWRPSLLVRVRRLGVGGMGLIGLALLSALVQLSAVAVNYVNYEIELRGIFPTDWNDPLAFGPPAQRLTDLWYSPVIGQWRLLFTDLRANTDLAWLWSDGNVQILTVALGLAALATLLLAGWGWWVTAGEMNSVSAPSWPVRTALPVLAVLVMATWLGNSSHDPLYGAPDEGYRAILAEVCTHADTGDAIISVAQYAYHIPMNWLGGLCDRGVPIFGYAPNSMGAGETQQVLSRVNEVYTRVWFVTSGLPPNDAENTIERWLAGVDYKADDRWFSDYRLVRYATPVNLSDSQPVPLDIFLTGAEGQQVTIWSVRAPGAIQAGEVVPVELTYQLDTPVTSNLRWFVQLLTANDYVAAQIDTAPDQGYATFVDRPVDEQYIERVALPMPDQLPPGRYRLIAGLYNPDAPNPNRLLTAIGKDYVDLGIVVAE